MPDPTAGQIPLSESRRVRDARRDTRNIILRELTTESLQRIVDAAEYITLASKDKIWESNQPIRSVYFPETAVISLVTLLDAGSIEAITIGNDGFVGLPVFHGPGATVTRANCQMPGESWRLSADAFRNICGDSQDLRQALARG